MPQPRIVLSGLGTRLNGLQWESDSALRIGRSDQLDIVLNDPSIGRRHAEVVHTGRNWVLRDLANHPRHPTLLNGNPIGQGDHTVRPNDVVQFGQLSLKVAHLEGSDPEINLPASRPVNGNGSLKTTTGFVTVQASTQKSWDEAVHDVAFNREQRPQQGQAMLTLLRTGMHIGQLASMDELLQSVLSDVTGTLGAQRGSILLANPASGKLELRAVFGPGSVNSRCAYSRTLAERAFFQGESLLCRDVRIDSDLLLARSVKEGTMGSIICALLRSPRRRIGVLQLDRRLLQEPFEENDLYLADAIAASVAVGIESAQLVEQQREQFVETVTALAHAVEMRDQYTGDHTRRVTEYSLLLADELHLGAVDRYHIQLGTPLHDIGKIGIDDAILRKPGKLTPGEFEAMKSHTVKGAAMIQTITNLASMIPIVKHHHERWDGAGYPDRLSRDEIPLTARIVAVADAFDAMTSDRPYRSALPVVTAFSELHGKAGSHFDPQCVQAFLRQRERVEALMRPAV